MATTGKGGLIQPSEHKPIANQPAPQLIDNPPTDSLPKALAQAQRVLDAHSGK